MNKKKTLLILILALAVLIAGAGALYNRLSDEVDTQQLAAQGETVTVPAAAAPDATRPPQQYAPDFTVFDLDGNPHKLSDFRGMPVVLNFWASWCGPCKMEMPDFDEKAKELAGQVQFLMVNLTDGAQETVASASAFVAEQGYTFPVFYDLHQSAAMAYGVYSIPTTYFINAEGCGVAYAGGAIDAQVLQAGIEMILK